MLKYSLLAEIRFKESVGHQLGSQYGENINNWLRLTNFNNRTGKRSSFVQHFKKVSRETKNNPTKYYRDNHDAIPPWILLPNLTIGEFKNLYSILNPSDREPVVESILYLSGQASQLQISYVSNALSVLWHFRNSLAHGSRLIDFHSRTSISLMQTQSVYGLSFLSQDEYQQKKIGANDLFCFIAVINLLLGKIDRENFLGEIKTFFVELQQLSETSTLFDSYLVKTRLPSDFLQRF